MSKKKNREFLSPLKKNGKRRKIPSRRRRLVCFSDLSVSFAVGIFYFRRSHCLSSYISWNSWSSFAGNFVIGLWPHNSQFALGMPDLWLVLFLFSIAPRFEFWIATRFGREIVGAFDLIPHLRLLSFFWFWREEVEWERWRLWRIPRVWFWLWRLVRLLGRVLSWRRKDLSVPVPPGREQVCDYVSWMIFFFFVGFGFGYASLLNFSMLWNAFVSWMQSDPFWICSICIFLYS